VSRSKTRFQQIGIFLALFLTARPAFAVPPLPAGWPSQVELGVGDGAGGAAGTRATAPFRFRYQYLAGGVNTGGGWAHWNGNGAFATYYIQDSIDHGMIPVFNYYMLLQSLPAGGADEGASNFINLNNAATMTAYYNDLKLFFQRAGVFPSRVVLHVEPDLWGFLQQRATADDATTVPAQVSATGLPELAGLPNNAAGFAQAVARLRDNLAPNVTLAYHVSVWGTGMDIFYSNTAPSETEALGVRSGNFYRSLGVPFDILFTDGPDRDAGLRETLWATPAAWWDDGDYANHVRFLAQVSRVAQRAIVMWQIPMGNTKMRAMNNTDHHYQDNHVERLLDDPSRRYLADYLNAGVVAYLFGGGDGHSTWAADAAGDGVSNPAPIAPRPALTGNAGANDMASSLAPAGAVPTVQTLGGVTTLVTPHAADDDGGYFRWRAWAYYQAGPLLFDGTTISSSNTKTSAKVLIPALVDGVHNVAVFGADAREILVLDAAGRAVYQAGKTGNAPLTWACQNDAGRTVPSGVYVVKIRGTDGGVQFQSLAVAK